MRRLIVTVICATVAVAIGATFAIAFSGKSGAYGIATSSSSPHDATPQPAGSLLALETESLTHKGLSPARAHKAILVQGEVAQANLVSKIEATLGSEFAGDWFEPATAQVHFGTTSMASQRTAERVIVRAGLTAGAVATPVRSSWGELQTAQHKWNQRLEALFARAEVQTALDASGNAVAITLGSAVPSTERAALELEASHANVNVNVNNETRP
jgi:hypothetical protein